MASTIRELSLEYLAGDDAFLLEDHHRHRGGGGHLLDSTGSVAAAAGTSTKDSNRAAALKSSVGCVYVDHDQFYDIDRPVNKAETPNWKAVLKTMKVIVQKGEQFASGLLEGESFPIFAVADISFWALRDFGTSLMKLGHQEKSCLGACRQITEEYPKFKRILKTLGTAIESYMKHNGYWATNNGGHINSRQNNSTRGGQLLVPILLYSRADDRFDLISLECGGGGIKGEGGHHDMGRNAGRRK